MIDTGSGLLDTLVRVNALRGAPPGGHETACRPVAEAIIDSLFRASSHLAIYGTLAPGQANHDVIAKIPGGWEDGYVCGDLYPAGWGATSGFPGMKWNPDGPRIPIKLFRSEHLGQHWQRLDAFEGSGYRRILVPVGGDAGLIAVANIYEVRL